MQSTGEVATKEGPLGPMLAVALLAHAGGLAAAGRLGARHVVHAPPTVELQIDASPLLGAAARAPEPPPAPPRVEPKPGVSPRPIVAPRVPRPPSPQPAPPTPGPENKIEEHKVAAVAAVVAEAQKILTSTEGSGPPVATGNATSTYGMVAGDGTGTAPTFDPRAGLGAAAAPTARPEPPEPDRSRAASAFMGFTDACDFPAEAEGARINQGWAYLVITVRPDGRAARVQVQSDSGHGFGRAAKACAERARYRPALDRKGRPVEQELPPLRYRFTR